MATCSTCHNNPAEAGQRTCPACQAAYMRQWRKTAGDIRDKRNIRRGIETLRAALIDTFERVGAAEMTGYTAADVVRRSLEP